MEVKKGYKITALGEIPVDWEIRSLDQVGNFYKGRGIKKSEVIDDGIPCIRYGELYTHHHEVIKNFNSYISKETAQQSQIIKTGDILFAGSGETKEEIGKCAVFLKEQETYAGGDIICLTPKDSNSLFLGFLLNDKIVAKQKAQLGQGDAVVHIYPNGLKQVLIPFPTLAEQTAIATALSDTDALLSSLEKLIEKKQLIKQGAMQELLRAKEGWEVKTIEEMCLPNGLVRGPFGGALKKEFFIKEGIKVYEQKNAIYHDIDLGNYFIDEAKYNELKRFEVKSGDFIVSCSGTIGRIFMMPENSHKGVINQALLKLQIDSEKFSKEYFYHYFSWNVFQEKIIESTQGGAMKNLVGMSEFKKTEIPIPPTLAEQTSIATVLSDMDAEIDSLTQTLTKYRHLKQGMMQELLTGKTRLI